MKTVWGLIFENVDTESSETTVCVDGILQHFILLIKSLLFFKTCANLEVIFLSMLAKKVERLYKEDPMNKVTGLNGGSILCNLTKEYKRGLIVTFLI